MLSVYYPLLYIVTLVFFFACEFSLIRQKRYKCSAGIAGIMLVLGVHFYISWYKMIYEPDYDPEGMVRTIDVVSASIILPLIYLYLARQFHLKMCCATTYLMFGMLFFCQFDQICFVSGVHPVDSTERLGELTFFVGSKPVIGYNVLDLTLLCQSFLLGWKIFKMRRKMLREEWKLKPDSAKFFLTFIVTLVVVFFWAAFNDAWWNDFSKFLYFTIYPILSCAILYMISKGYDVMPVVDKNDEPRFLEVAPKFTGLYEKFERLINDEQIFLDKELNIQSLSKRLGSNRTYVSQMIKEKYGESFSQKICRHRLAYAKEYILQHPEMKLVVVAEESGFGSSSAFFKVFKDLEGMSPSEWTQLNVTEREQ